MFSVLLYSICGSSIEPSKPIENRKGGKGAKLADTQQCLVIKRSLIEKAHFLSVIPQQNGVSCGLKILSKKETQRFLQFIKQHKIYTQITLICNLRCCYLGNTQLYLLQTRRS